MESRTLSLLEFPKVLDRLARLAASEPAAAACRAIVPLGDVSLVAREQQKLAEALELRRDRAFEFTPFPDLEPLFPVLDSERRVLDLDALAALAHVLSRVAALREALGRPESGEEGASVLGAIV
ncbi:MAG: endonuclease MutS2, partial [Acidobacteriota bacterium]